VEAWCLSTLAGGGYQRVGLQLTPSLLEIIGLLGFGVLLAMSLGYLIWLAIFITMGFDDE